MDGVVVLEGMGRILDLRLENLWTEFLFVKKMAQVLRAELNDHTSTPSRIRMRIRIEFG